MITEFRYERNINLGNYETARLGVTVSVDGGRDAEDGVDEMIKKAADFVWKQLLAERAAKR